MANKNIVIVGGGYAGIKMASALESLVEKTDEKYTILLVEKKSHFYHAVGGPRSVVDEIDEKILVPYTNLFKNKHNKVIQAAAIRFDEHTLYLDKSVKDFGTSIDFAYLIIASGTDYAAPSKMPAVDYEDCLAYIKDSRKQVTEAKSILIVGGGPVGIELVGEIRDKYSPDQKKITVVHSKGFLGDDTLPQKTRNKLLSLFESAKVNLILNDHVIFPQSDKPLSTFKPSGPIKTEKGESIDADLVLVAFGSKPQSDWIKTSFPGLVSKAGYVDVKPTLQVNQSGLENVLVIGDVADLKETKMAFRTSSHVDTAVQTIKSLIEGKLPTKEYKSGANAMIITFGKTHGTGVLPIFNMYIGDCLTSLFKGKSLFIDATWKSLNSSPPN
ncbi:hypothetical protein CLU79DRAFT_737843 [Phycomyces nitens]|nr:hypothetical protein CLU79DRAFT_737843 [Phycomyces nitens]